MHDDDTIAFFYVEGVYISMGDDTGLTANNLNWAISNKRLGIGTASPDSPLHIYQNATNTHVNIQNDTKPWIIGVRDDASDALVFRQNAANLVTISHTTGNLEVLTANAKISGSSSSTGSFGTIYATEGSGPNVQIFNGGTRYLNIHQNQLTFENAGGVVRTVGSRALVLQTNSTTAIAIDTSQNVGIGQATPQSDNSTVDFLHIGDSSCLLYTSDAADE